MKNPECNKTGPLITEGLDEGRFRDSDMARDYAEFEKNQREKYVADDILIAAIAKLTSKYPASEDFRVGDIIEIVSSDEEIKKIAKSLCKDMNPTMYVNSIDIVNFAHGFIAARLMELAKQTPYFEELKDNGYGKTYKISSENMMEFALFIKSMQMTPEEINKAIDKRLNDRELAQEMASQVVGKYSVKS